MYPLLRNALLSIVIFWFYTVDHCSPMLNKRVVFISLEHPRVIDTNPKLISVLNVTSRRFSRADPAHYVNLWLHYFKPLGNITEITMTVAEFLSNEYRPTFVMMSINFCDFFYKFLKTSHIYYTTDASIPVKPSDPTKTCAINTGIYYYANISLPLKSLPDNFPFEKGRVTINQTYKSKLVVSGTIDIELKTTPLRKYKDRS